ncbi:MAG: hypothetical protein R8K20_11615 [Gallionellaceae bacterium]
MSKFDLMHSGESVEISPDELELVTIRDFLDIAADTGYLIQVESMGAGWYRLLVES